MRAELNASCSPLKFYLLRCMATVSVNQRFSKVIVPSPK